MRTDTADRLGGLFHAGPVGCPVRRLTGLPCPSCGLARALVLLLEGRPRESVSYHPLALPIAAGAAVALGIRLLRHTGPVAPVAQWTATRAGWLYGAAVGVVLATWIIRLRDPEVRQLLVPERGGPG